MPERPDLEYVVPVLDRALRDVTIAGVVIRKPVVLRVAVTGGVQSALENRVLRRVFRRAHFVHFALDAAVDMVVSPMLAGRFLLVDPKAKVSADTAVQWQLSNGQELRYRDDVQMGKLYVIPKGQTSLIPGYDPVGLDVLDPTVFTREAFRTLAKKRRDQVKVFLMDKTALDSMGNAYADEVCFAARMHPKTRVASLKPAQLDLLHDAIVTVLGEATRTIAQRKPLLDEKVRDFLKVRGREGKPCLVCGTTVRAAGVHGHDACFCPQCQPDEKGTAIVDWRKLGRG